MRWPQFSLVTLAGIVTFCAVGCSALVYASSAWAGFLVTAAVVFLLFAASAAVYRQGHVRAFWLGASIWGWLYLLLSAWLFSSRHQAHPSLGTTQLSLWAYEHVLPKFRTPPQPAAGGGPGGFLFGSGVNSDAGLSGTVMTPEGGMSGMGGGGSGPVPSPSYYPGPDIFLRVSHALWLWLFALAGGAVGRWLYQTRR